ncbi:Retrovirus-related Pol polyprotein from type-2 retrotransposable element R2DM [Sesamum angolense]|uniref:Retrovirus-related Pol polyprotein from type-2 retrotransposable element R2DM n=1 Tax=Sesamum angolense TaxID=2727404 RepID=A0AAE2C0J6_9LAMI|nr:Retrovirus-related Pol polyprotein from type-2 retrotransposable element R2DM [Sesamum angolense]
MLLVSCANVVGSLMYAMVNHRLRVYTSKALVSLKSTLQSTIASSTMEAEYMAITVKAAPFRFSSYHGAYGSPRGAIYGEAAGFSGCGIELWESDLILLGTGCEIVGGDFNTVLSPDERSGGSAPSGIAMSDFHDAIVDSALVDAGYVGSPYTCRTIVVYWLSRVHCGMEGFVFSFPVYVDHAFRVSWSGPSELVVPDVFGNVFDKVAVAEQQLKEADDAYDQNPCDRTLVERNRFFAELVQVLAQEETFWRQKADPTAIKDSTASFFQRLLTAEPVFPEEMDNEYLKDGLPDEDRRSLCVMPTLEEDVFDAVIKFFHGVEMSKGFTATTISLIPKTVSPTCWSEYQSISLCNVTNKICTKLMTIRLGHVLPKVLSLSQSGFVPGRLLSDTVLLAQELIYSLESRRPEANVVFKLDMAKAYDRVNWEFHFQVLRRKGFPQCSIDLVANAVSHCWFSVLVNGEHAGFFHSTHGLRQGDPLSPALFVLAADYLMRGLDQLFAAYPTMYYQALGWIRVSHLAYADDLMIFTTMCRWNMELLRDFLRAYERVSGQLINGMKSFLLWAARFRPYRRKQCRLGNDKSLSCLDSKCVADHSVASASVAKSGLGVRSLADYIRTFSMKLWWRFRSKLSLWSFGIAFVAFGMWWSLFSSGPWVKVLFLFGMIIGLERSLYPSSCTRIPTLWSQIPVDARMRQKGFRFPSKCQCCEAEETVSHLFIDSTAMQGMWQHFVALFGLCLCDTGSLTHMRNAAKYHGIPFSTDGIILEVQLHRRTLYAARTLTSRQWKGDLHRAAIMGFIFRQTIPRAPSIVRWRAPSPSWFKFNTNGSFFGNPGLAGAADIIRDSAGHVHLAYRVALGTGTSVLAGLCRLAGFGACPDPQSSPLGGGGGCHEGDFTLTVPCFWEVGGTTSDYAYYMPPTVATSGRSTRFQGGE